MIERSSTASSSGDSATVAPERGRWERAIVPASLMSAVLLIAAFAALAWLGHQDAREKGERQAQSLLEASSSYLVNQIDLWTIALDLAEQAWIDGGRQLTDENTRHLVKLVADKAGFIGSLLFLDRDGNIVADPMSAVERSGNFSDRDYFRAHVQDAGGGVYVSQPYNSRLRNGEASIGFSRRLETGRGEFTGIVLVAARLSSIRQFFERIDLGPGGIISLVSSSGRIIVRQPSLGHAEDVGVDLSKSPNFQRMVREGRGTFDAVSVTDQVSRSYTFARVPGTDFIIVVAPATEQIFATWKTRTISFGALTAIMCLAVVLLAVRLKRELQQKEAAQQHLAALALRDSLTGLANRRRFDDTLAREFRRAQRTGKIVSLCLIDVDHFKSINDEFGHTVGDAALRILARCIIENARRPGDQAARFGGDEFALILPETPAQEAAKIGEAIRHQFERDTSFHPGLGRRCTLSVGIVQFDSDAVPDGHSALEAADAALYQAKKARDTVAIYPGNDAALEHQDTATLYANETALPPEFPLRVTARKT